MHDQLEQSPKYAGSHKRQKILLWLLLIGMLIWLFVDAYRRHSDGQSWASALGFSMDLRFLASFVGGFVIPLVMTMAMLRYVGRLSLSREKTILTRIGWSLYGYLFIWSVFLTYFLHPY